MTRINQDSQNFQKAMAKVADGFVADLIDDREAIKLIIQAFHGQTDPDAFACPWCGHRPRTRRVYDRFVDGNRIRCSGCARHYTWKTKTPFEHGQVTPGQAAVFAFFFARDFRNLSQRDVARIIGRDSSTVYLWRRELGETP